MMPRVVRRAPWIAVGAVAAFYLDPSNGAVRRRAALGRAREWSARLRGPGGLGGPRGVRAADVPLTPSVPDERVESRAAVPLPEEQRAGVPDSAREAMAQQILVESEWRVTDRAGTSVEHRRSEETVPRGG